MKKIVQIVPVIVVSVIAGFVLSRFVDGLSDTEAPVPAIVEKKYLNGSELLTACKNQLEMYDKLDKTEIGVPYDADCFGLLLLALDPSTKRLLHVCAPDKLKAQQAIPIVVKFLEKNPQRLHEPAMGLVLSALDQAFPCK